MSLRSWGPGRIVASCFGYWFLLLSAGSVYAGYRYRDLRMAHGDGDLYVVVWHFHVAATLLLFFGPPLALLGIWLRTRRR